MSVCGEAPSEADWLGRVIRAAERGCRDGGRRTRFAAQTALLSRMREGRLKLLMGFASQDM